MLIDRDNRRHDIANAVWRIVVRHGVSAVSVREVATETGLAVGAVRHVFATRSDLLEYSLGLIHEQVRERVAAHLSMRDPVELGLAVLAEMLPLDDRRRMEVAVSTAVVAGGASDPALRRAALDSQRAVADTCAAVLSVLRRAKRMTADSDLRYETERLHALVDGLALHALTREPNELRPRAIVALLRAHLMGLGDG